MLNSLNEHYKNCMVDSKENYKFDLRVKGFICDLTELKFSNIKRNQFVDQLIPCPSY